MSNCAIVCEYNPFHSGHQYQIRRARERGFGNIVCVMSGNFTQSGTAAFCEKSIRAECAVLGGADAVIELPAVYATASAGYFAEGALKIIRDIKNISALVMGSTADSDVILRIADIAAKQENKLKTMLKSELESGKSYNMASIAALSRVVSEIDPDIKASDVVCEPNNMLCLEYIKAIKSHAPNIEPVIIKRDGNIHRSESVVGSCLSATAIRKAFETDNGESVRNYIPYCFNNIEKWHKEHPFDSSAYKKLAVFSMKKATTDYIGRLRDCSEGMEYLIKSLCASASYDEILSTAASKRYGQKRIERLFLDCVLGIEKDLLFLPFCTRLLGCKNNFDFSILPKNVKTTNTEIKNAASDNTAVGRVLQIDEKITALFNTFTNKDGDFYNYSLVKR